MQTQDRFQNESSISRPHNLNEANATVLSPKKITVGVGNRISALPPPFPSFTELLPTTIFSILKGFQLIYFLAFAILLLFRYCSTQIGPMIAQLGFLIGYIVIQLAEKYLTYQSFIANPFSNTSYDILDETGWQNVRYEDLQVGQIIRINQKERFPVTVLPITTSSMKNQNKQDNYIFIDNFPITKMQQLAKVDILKELKTVIDKQHQSLRVNSYDRCEISYSFASSMGQIFQANLSAINGGSEVKIRITNNNIIPRNITLSTQKYLIGVILYNLENDRRQDIKQVIYTHNGIDTILSKHIIIIITINIVLSLILALAACFTIFFVNYHNLFSDLGCYFLNALTLLSHSIHITMYVALILRRFIDAIVVNRRGSIQVRNYIQSLDEFGIVDTIISDDKLFLQRRLLQVQKIVQDTSQIKTQIILQLIEKTPKLKNLYPDQWLAVYRYNREQKTKRKYNYSIGISGQRSDNCYGICIQYQNNSYLVNFSNKAKYSLLQSATYGTKQKFNRALEDVRKKNLEGCFLTLPVEISKINNYLSKQAMYISQNQMKICCLIVFRVVIAEDPARLLRKLYGKFNIILMTDKNWDMMENLLTFTGLKKNNEDNMVTFEELELQQFSQQLRYRINAQQMDQYNLNLSSNFRSKKSKNYDNRAFIYGFDGSLITHLSRAQIRQSLKILALKSKIMIFFNCKQYQKQICATNLFKIFNNNLFFTNFLCDQQLCRRSNLSACLSIAPAPPFTTISIDTYESLNSLLNQYSVYSIRTTLMIIYSFIFKNEVLIFGSLTTLFLVYRGHNFYTGLQYTDYIFLFYNLFFTLIPFIYYLIARPQSYQSKIIPKYQVKLLFFEHLKGIGLGISLAFLLHAITAEQFTLNVYLALLICSVFAANLYFLVLDHSVSKCIPTILILVQCAIVVGVFFLILLVGYELQQKIILIEQNLSHANYWFYVGTFVVGIFYTVLVLFSISFITSLNENLKSVSVQSEQLYLEKSLIGRVTTNGNKYSGKQMRFRQSIELNEEEDVPLRKGFSIEQSKQIDILKAR